VDKTKIGLPQLLCALFCMELQSQVIISQLPEKLSKLCLAVWHNNDQKTVGALEVFSQ
jgi:hypothetical protein